MSAPFPTRAHSAREHLDFRCYFVTGSGSHDEIVARAVAAARGGAGIIQVRSKPITEADLYRLAADVSVAVTQVNPNCAVLVDDVVELVAKLKTDGYPIAGVHVGQDDMNVAKVREILGPGAVIGLTTGTVELARAANAYAEELDYIGCGPFRATPTKDSGRSPLGISGYPPIVAASAVPVVAIGDVTIDDAQDLAATGVAGVAIVRGIMHAANPEEYVAGVVKNVTAGQAASRRAEQVEVNIIGAGMVGLATAVELAHHGHSVRVLDPSPASGATSCRWHARTCRGGRLSTRPTLPADAVFRPVVSQADGDRCRTHGSSNWLSHRGHVSGRCRPRRFSTSDGVDGLSECAWYGCGETFGAPSPQTRTGTFSGGGGSRGNSGGPPNFSSPDCPCAARCTQEHGRGDNPRTSHEARRWCGAYCPGTISCETNCTVQWFGRSRYRGSLAGNRHQPSKPKGGVPASPGLWRGVTTPVPRALAAIVRSSNPRFCGRPSDLHHPAFRRPHHDRCNQSRRSPFWPPASSVYDLLRDAIRLVPGIEECEFLEATTGARPGTPNDLPYLGRVSANLVISTGYFRHGILLSALAARVSRELIEGATPDQLSVDISACAPFRDAR